MKSKITFIRIIAVLCAAVLLAAPLCACADTTAQPKPSRAEIIAVARHGVVEVLSGDTMGSGIVIKVSGRTLVLTNNHVISAPESVKVRFNGQSEPITAKVLGSESTYDMCLLEPSAVPDDARVLDFAFDPKQGEDVIALGINGRQAAAFEGIVSTVDKLVFVEEVNSWLYVLQTTAGFISGCSGGALLNAEGGLLGICTFCLSFKSGNKQIETGLTYAVPSVIAQAIVQRILTLNAVNPDKAAKVGTPFTILGDFTVATGADSGWLRFNMGDGYLNVVEGANPNQNQNPLFYTGDKIVRINDYTVESSMSRVLAEIYKKHGYTEFHKG